MGVELKNTLARVSTHSTQHFSAGGPNCEQRATIPPTLMQTSGSAVENGCPPITITGEDNKESEWMKRCHLVTNMKKEPRSSRGSLCLRLLLVVEPADVRAAINTSSSHKRHIWFDRCSFTTPPAQLHHVFAGLCWGRISFLFSWRIFWSL